MILRILGVAAVIPLMFFGLPYFDGKKAAIITIIIGLAWSAWNERRTVNAVHLRERDLVLETMLETIAIPYSQVRMDFHTTGVKRRGFIASDKVKSKNIRLSTADRSFILSIGIARQDELHEELRARLKISA